MRFRLVGSHERSLDVAPCVAKGDRVVFVRDDDGNPGWFYGRTAGGVAGYFPAEWFDVARERHEATARRDYDAMEISVTAGHVVEAVDSIAGWRLVRTADGRVGWVPGRILEPEQ